MVDEAAGNDWLDTPWVARRGTPPPAPAPIAAPPAAAAADSAVPAEPLVAPKVTPPQPTTEWPTAPAMPNGGEFIGFATRDKASFRAWQVVHDQTESVPAAAGAESFNDTAAVQARHIAAAALQVVARVGVDRAQLAALLADPGQLMVQVRALFEAEDAEMVLAIEEAMPGDPTTPSGFTLAQAALARAYPPL